ncbi:helix-turn-helix transcriptional regulator [Umezawaea tangerina]|nr:helix-turn-helix transcriptional regulator [Umezawaea tangerina]
MSTVAELGAEISERVGRWVPHDGYLLVGLDPVTGAGCFLAEENAYGPSAKRELEIEEAASGPSPWRTPGPVLRLGPDATVRHGPQVRSAMAADGFGAALRVAVRWGELVLLRGHGRSFTTAESAAVERLVTPLADRVRRFVTDNPLHPVHHSPPGVVVVNSADEITTSTPSARAALRALTSSGNLLDPIRNITHLARQAPTLSRLPTPTGWLALHAERTAPAPDTDVVITIQPAAGTVLLPAVAAWYGITPAERTIIEQALQGLPGKQIARRLHLSPHTVNDHFKSIYRKTHVHSREELLAGLG